MRRLFLLLLLWFFVENIQPDDADHHRCNGQRVADHTGDTTHVDVVDQPAGETDQIQNTDHPGIVNTQRDRGDQLCDDHKNAEGAVPGEQSQQHKQDGKDNLKNQVTFAFFVSVPVNTVGKTAGQIDAHARITAEKNVVNGRKEGVADLAKYDAVVFFLLHTDHNKGRAHKSDY